MELEDYESRLRVRMALHIQDHEEECRQYWKEGTHLGDSQFISSVVKKPSVARKPLPFGTLTVRYNSLELLREIKNDISRLVEECGVHSIGISLGLGKPPS